jgi:hypothetical protein
LELTNVFETIWVKVVALTGLLTYISLCIIKVTRAFDDALSAEARANISAKLLASVSPFSEGIKIFGNLFTSVFGDRHISRKCIKRSITLSSIIFCLLGFALGAFTFDFSSLGALNGAYPTIAAMAWILSILVFGAIFNGLIDYLSLWQTRIVIRSEVSVISKVFWNLLLTTFVIFASLKLMFFLLIYVGLSTALSFEDTSFGALALLPFVFVATGFMGFPPESGSMASIIFLTGYAPTFWLLVHLLSGALTNIAPKFIRVLNVKSQPVRSIGVISVILIWLLAAIIILFYAVYVLIM